MCSSRNSDNEIVCNSGGVVEAVVVAGVAVIVVDASVESPVNVKVAVEVRGAFTFCVKKRTAVSAVSFSVTARGVHTL